MQGPGTTEPDEREIPWIVALFNRHLANGERHLGDRNIDDGERRRKEIQAQRPADDLLDPGRSGLRVELHLATEKIFRADAPQNHIRVGNRRLKATEAVADRAGVRTCASRADLQGADFVDPGDAAAASADLDDVDDRDHDRVTAFITA